MAEQQAKGKCGENALDLYQTKNENDEPWIWH